MAFRCFKRSLIFLLFQLNLFAGMALEASLGLHKLILRILSSPIVIKNFADTGGPE